VDSARGQGWAKNRGALAGRLRRAQTFLRMLGIESTFSREGRTGTRMIRVSTNAENSVSTVSIVSAACNHGSRADQAIFLRTENRQHGADDADGADANSGLRFGCE